MRHAQGFFTLERTCPTCQGRGQVIEDPCPSCAGSGRVTRERTLSVNIPPGVEDGTRIRLAGEGEAGVRGGPPGDLYIFLSLAPHEFFQRDGADLHCRVPISMVTAALGGEFEVPTIDGGKTRVKVPGRHPVRPAVPAYGQGHAGAALQADRRHVRPGRGRDAAEPDQAPARTAARVREAVVATTPSRSPRDSSARSRSSSTAPAVAPTPLKLDPWPSGFTYTRKQSAISVVSVFIVAYALALASRAPRKEDRRRLDESAFHPFLDRKAAVDGRGDAVGQAAGAHHGGYVDPEIAGPVIELGPGTGPVTEALVDAGIDPARLVLVEFNPTFCRLLRTRYPDATVVQGDAYRLQRLLGRLLRAAGRGGGVRPAAVHQAAEAAHAADARGVRADGAGRAVRAVHLCDGAADPEGAQWRECRGLRAHLDEPAAGAGLGLPQELISAFPGRPITAMSHPKIPAIFSSGALVICEQVIVPKAENAFDDMDNLKRYAASNSPESLGATARRSGAELF